MLQQSAEFELKGAVALVTGSSRGLGRAIALRLARAGADLIVHYGQQREAADRVAAEVAACGRRARVVGADFTSRAEIETLFHDFAEASIDILVNNAGVWKPSPLGNTRPEDLDEIVNVNLKSVFWVTQCALRVLRPGARIVNISSVAGRVGLAGGRSLYGATKAAVDAFTRNWALELAPRGIRVNAVAPGYVLTDMTAEHFSNAEVHQRAVSRHPFGRLGNAEEIADVVAFLCSSEAGWITGQSVNVSGGFVI